MSSLTITVNGQTQVIQLGTLSAAVNQQITQAVASTTASAATATAAAATATSEAGVATAAAGTATTQATNAANSATASANSATASANAYSAIANGTATSAGTLLATDIEPLSRGAGLLQTTLGARAAFSIQAYQGYLLPGSISGATPRTVSAALTDYPSVRSAGMLADGATEESAHLVTALTANPTLQIPAGQTVYIATNVTLPANTTLLGPGKILLGPGGMLILQSGSVLSGVTIDGDNFTNATDGVRAATNSVDVRILFCKFVNIWGNAFSPLSGCTKVLVYETFMSNIGGPNIIASYEGCGIYSSSSEIDVIGGFYEKTNGQAAIFINGTTRANIEGVRIRDTYYRGIQTYGSCTAVSVSECNIMRTGSINPGPSGVGCNGMYMHGASVASDVVVSNNWIENVGENCIEGLATIVNNTCINSNYNGLTTPSIEGIYPYGGAICDGNRVFNAKGVGINLVQNSNMTSLTITRNRIYSPGSTGISVNVLGVGVVASGIVVDGNEIYDFNAANSALQGIYIAGNSGGSVASSFCNNNKLIGGVRTLNTIQSGAVESHNSFDTEHPLTLNDPASNVNLTSAGNASAGGYRRHIYSYGINFNGTGYTLAGGGNASTAFVHDNNSIGLYYVPSSVSGPLTPAQLSSYQVAQVTATGFKINGSAWNSTQLLQIGAYYIWADSLGRLRFKSGSPTSDTDGRSLGLGYIGADAGDTSTVVAAASYTVKTLVYNTPLTTNRSVQLPTTGATDGDRIRVVRTASATGSSTLTVTTTPWKVLAAGQWADAEWWAADGVWITTGSGSL
jgi:hypothetical protein